MPLLRRVRLRGGEGVITWGYHTAAVLRAWTIAKTERERWTLTATMSRADAFMLKQRGLSFNAPRRGGYWQWPIVALTLTPTGLVATLGQPEQ